MKTRMFLIGAALVCITAVPAAAEPPLRCGTGQTLVNIEEKECPAGSQPAVVVRRVCCKNPAGHVQCRPFPKCPSVSPS